MPTTYAIPNGRTVMDATLYIGNGYPTSGTQSISNNDLGSNGFKPDFVWIKQRNGVGNNTLTDSVRGTNSQLFSNQAVVQETVTDAVTAFNSNGFNLGANAQGTLPYVNSNNQSFVAWQWQAGAGTTSSNTSGTITSTVSVNATAGFSVATWTGTGSVATIGHGLGVAPAFIITKSRSIGNDWLVYHQNLGNTQFIYLDATTAAQSATAAWNNTSPTSTVWTTGTNSVINTNGSTNVTYAWASIAGFSQFGYYTGNGSTNGPFVYTGFKPKFLMYKRTDSAGGWFMVDSTRNPSNTANYWLNAAAVDAEQTDDAIDLNSNGFKIRTTGTGTNASNGNYVYAVFAENPFKYANAR